MNCSSFLRLPCSSITTISWRRQSSSLEGGRRLRRMLESSSSSSSSSSCSYLMEAHSALSARICDEAGFEGVWLSGLTSSATRCLRDANEMSMDSLVTLAEDMVHCVKGRVQCVLVDADTGLGNFNNARHLLRLLERRGVAGMCIEDKVFPKNNSFVHANHQLVSVDNFCGKIKACKDAQTSEHFVLVARLEAFIAGKTLEEALHRAHAYAQAGADAVLVHSRRKDAKEIEAFMRHWDQRVPVIAVPTTYSEISSAHLSSLGVSCLIFANHTLRASIRAMQSVTRSVFERGSIAHLNEEHVVDLKEVFRLQNEEELRRAESKYLPSTNQSES